MATRSAIPVVFGVMTIGKAGIEGVRVSDLEEANKMLDIFQSCGHTEVDTARLYGGGSSEEYMAAANWQGRKLVMDTKLYPNEGKGMAMAGNTYSHRPEDYLHGPDRNTSLEDTLREVNNLYNEDRFNRFGISNYVSWEVAAICEICERHGWIKPAVYQGIYNALHRGIEPELLPCLRKYEIALYSFQPLAGGFLTSRYKRDMKEDEYEAGSRFDPKRWQGKLHHGQYMNNMYFDALDIIRPVAAKYSLTEAECALRWLEHHSLMSEEKGDKIIIGASSANQLEQNLSDLEKGPLPQDVIDALDAGWARVKGVVPKYFH